MTAWPPTTRNSTRWASSNVQSSIQSGGIWVVVANPERVQLGSELQSLFWSHASHFVALGALSINVTG